MGLRASGWQLGIVVFRCGPFKGCGFKGKNTPIGDFGIEVRWLYIMQPKSAGHITSHNTKASVLSQ